MIKSIVVTNADPLVLVELRKDYIMLGFSTSPIDKDSFTVFTRRPEHDLTKNRKKKDEVRDKRARGGSNNH